MSLKKSLAAKAASKVATKSDLHNWNPTDGGQGAGFGIDPDAFDKVYERDRKFAERLKENRTAEDAEHEPAESLTRTSRRRPSAVEIVSAKILCETFPHLNEVLIAHLIRVGEVCNLIAASKTGKSWLTLHLALCVATGLPFLGIYSVRRGRVLFIDNELHPSVLASRIKAVAEAMDLRSEEYADNLQILSLRGRLMDVYQISHTLEHITPGEYSLVIVDAFYRCLPDGTDENSNGQMAHVYNTIDAMAARLKAAIVLIHHSSKGSQSQKRVTDVGSGAGSISRAADCHLTIRDLEEEGAMVLEAALRSFPPLQPIGLRYQFPLWLVDEGLDVTALKGNKSDAEEKLSKRDEEADAAILAALQEHGDLSRTAIGKKSGVFNQRRDRSLVRLGKAGLVESHTADVKGNKDAEVFRLLGGDTKEGDTA